MKITSIECFPIRLKGHPYMGGHTLSRGKEDVGRYVQHDHYRAIYIREAQTFMVKITTDEGVVGWGETQAGAVPEVLTILVKELIEPRLLGADPFDREKLRDLLYDQMRERGHESGFYVDAVSACDIALWDLIGHATDQPIHQLLGGARRDRLPCYVSGVPADSVEEQIEAIESWLERGFSRFKISLGFGVRADLDHVERLRNVFGDRIEILVDAHWAYELSDAIRVSRGFERLGVSFIECPLIPEDPHLSAQLVRSIDLRVALGEEFRTRYAFKERLRQRSMDLAQPDFGRLGITEGWRVIQLCHAFSTPVAPHLGSGLGLYIAAGLQIAAATPDLYLIEYQPTQYEASRDLFPDLPHPADGYCLVPSGPGLGLAPEEDQVRSFTIR